MLSDLEVMQDVGERLEKGSIEYMLTGSVAMNYYAEPRMTRDIDLVVALDPLDRKQRRPDPLQTHLGQGLGLGAATARRAQPARLGSG